MSDKIDKMKDLKNHECCAIRINNEDIVGGFQTNIVWYIQHLIKNILYSKTTVDVVPTKSISSYLYTNIKHSSYYNPQIKCENNVGYYVFISTLYNKIYFSREGFHGASICFSWERFARLSIRENMKINEFYENLYKFLEIS